MVDLGEDHATILPGFESSAGAARANVWPTQYRAASDAGGAGVGSDQVSHEVQAEPGTGDQRRPSHRTDHTTCDDVMHGEHDPFGEVDGTRAVSDVGSTGPDRVGQRPRATRSGCRRRLAFEA
jgi:hypothetical protein